MHIFKQTHLDSNVVVWVSCCYIEEDSKQWEDRSLDEEHTFWPHNHHRQKSHEHCDQPQRPRHDPAFPVPLYNAPLQHLTNKSPTTTTTTTTTTSNYYFHLPATGEPGSASSPSGPRPASVLEENLWGLMKRGFYGLHVLPATQPPVSKPWREHKALTITSGLALSFLHPQPYFWQKRRCSFQAGSPMPVPLLN